MERRFGGTMGENYDDQLLMRVFSHHVGLYQAWQLELLRLLATSFPDESAYSVVEGGCGTGFSTGILLAAHSGISLVSVDSEPLMLAKAKGRLENESRARFVASDILSYLASVPDGSLHAFATAFLLHNTAPDIREKVVPEVFRVLRPGGVYVNADRCGRDSLTEYYVDLAAQIQALSAFLALGRPDQYELWFSHILRDENWRFQEGEQRNLLVASGFEAVEMISRYQTECLFAAVKPR